MCKVMGSLFFGVCFFVLKFISKDRKYSVCCIVLTKAPCNTVLLSLLSRVLLWQKEA